jgi:hypothetical protein
MGDFVHVYIYAFVNTINLSLNIINYTNKDSDAICTWRKHNRNTTKLKLWRNIENAQDIRCFDCVPWGNTAVSNIFSRVGALIADMDVKR